MLVMFQRQVWCIYMLIFIEQETESIQDTDAKCQMFFILLGDIQQML